jgi:hypothetical protein
MLPLGQDCSIHAATTASLQMHHVREPTPAQIFASIPSPLSKVQGPWLESARHDAHRHLAGADMHTSSARKPYPTPQRAKPMVATDDNAGLISYTRVSSNCALDLQLSSVCQACCMPLICGKLCDSFRSGSHKTWSTRITTLANPRQYPPTGTASRLSSRLRPNRCRGAIISKITLS